MKKILYILGMGVLFGCSDSYLVDNGVNLSEGKPCGMVRMADLSSTGIYAINGFAKHGEKLVMGSSYMQQGVAYAVDLSSPLSKALPLTKTYADKVSRTLSSFSSFDGKSVAALDFKTGELLENMVSGPESGDAGVNVIRLPKGRQHLAAVKTGNFVLSTGVYEEGRYLLYSLADSTEHYSLSYPVHPDYPEIGEKTKGVLYASSILRIHPDGNRFVCADMYSGALDFCRIDSDSISRIKLERLSYPRVEIEEQPSVRVAYSKRNRIGFMDVAVTSERVYALYSGKTYEKDGKEAFVANRLLEYDWAGNLVRNFELSVALTNLACDGADGALYGIAETEGVTLVKLEL